MNKKFAWLAIAGSIGLLLSGCSKGPQTSDKPGSIGTEVAQKSGTKEATPAPGDKGEKTAATTPDAKTETPPAPTGDGKSTGGETKIAAQPDAKQPAAVPQLKPGQQNVDVESLPSDMTILTVAATPVTVGEYRRMYKMQQVQLESMSMTNPMVRANLLQQAKQLKIELTADEKNKLLEAAKKSKAPDEKSFQKYLADNKITADQFNKEIFEIGVAVKAVNAILQQSLLNDLINRELLCKFGKESGFATKSMNKYIEFKHSPQYKLLSEATKLSGDDLRDEITKNELSRLMLEKVQGRASVTDKELQQFYSKNKDKFQHKERIRMSQIIVAAPSVDGGSIVSVKSQVKKEFPKLEGKELDDKVTMVMNAQRQKAEAIITMAKSGQDFAKLANTMSDDMQAQKEKTGGDMGYQQKDQLIPELAKAVWPLKAGQIYPGLVQTGIGYHIFKVTEHQGPGAASLAEIKPQLKAILLQQKQQQVLNNWLRDKRQATQLVLAPQFAQLLQNSTNQTSSLNSTLPH